MSVGCIHVVKSGANRGLVQLDQLDGLGSKGTPIIMNGSGVMLPSL